MPDPQLLAFAGIAALLTVTPGADTLLVVRNVLARGRRAGLLATGGVCSGLFLHAILSGLGLSLILVRSSSAFQAVKFAGACYLFLLGAQSLIHAVRTSRRSAPGPLAKPADPAPERRARPYFEGLLTNALNPKVAIFYVAFLPQFIRVGDAVLARSVLLASIHFTLGICWLSALTLFLCRIQGALERPRVKSAIESIAGLALIGFGARLALAHR